MTDYDVYSLSPRSPIEEDLLTTALEGGSDYWYYLPDLSMVPKGRAPLSVRIFRAVMYDDRSVPVTDVNERGTKSESERLGFITSKRIRAALREMSSPQSKYRQVAARIASEDYDASDADVWFQFVVMGKVVYG